MIKVTSKNLRCIASYYMFLFIFMYIFSVKSALADEHYWIGQSDNEWNNPNNWINNSVPVNNDSINLIDTLSIPILTTSIYPDTPGYNLSSLTIDGGSGTFIHNGGYLPVIAEFIGLNGYGSYSQWGGTNKVQSLQIGVGPASEGHYYLGGTGSVLSYGQEDIGAWGTGTFTQSGGVHESTGAMVIGNNYGSIGTYILLGGTVSSNLIALGVHGNGTFRQDGGTNTVSSINIGLFPVGSGKYDIYNGKMDASYLIIGTSGTGVFNQWGGDVKTTLLKGGNIDGGVGTYNMYNGNLTSSRASFGENLSTGIFNQYGGINTSGDMSIGSQGIYNLHGGTLLANNIINNGIFNAIGDYGSGGYGAYNITNNGNWNIGTKNVSWNVSLNNFENNGTLKITNSTVYYAGNFVNNGAYISDPSINIFNNLTVGSNGYLAGALGDVFKINGDLIVKSLNNTQWNTSGASLEFSSGIHTLDLIGSTVNFHWGTLEIDDGGYFSNTSNGDIFADVFKIYDFMGFLTEFQGNGIHINYGSLFAFDADGSSYLLTGEQLTQLASLGITQTPVPEPSTMLLLGSGLAGLVGYGRRRFKK